MFGEVGVLLFIAKLRGTRIWLEWHGQGLLETSKQEQKCNLISRDRQSIGKRMAHVFKIVKKKEKLKAGRRHPRQAICTQMGHLTWIGVRG